MKLCDIYKQDEWDEEFASRMWKRLRDLDVCSVEEIVLPPRVFEWFESESEKVAPCAIAWTPEKCERLRDQVARGYSIWSFGGLKVKRGQR
jgi:hypothetical protein